MPCKNYHYARSVDSCICSTCSESVCCIPVWLEHWILSKQLWSKAEEPPALHILWHNDALKTTQTKLMFMRVWVWQTSAFHLLFLRHRQLNWRTNCNEAPLLGVYVAQAVKKLWHVNLSCWSSLFVVVDYHCHFSCPCSSLWICALRCNVAWNILPWPSHWTAAATLQELW